MKNLKNLLGIFFVLLCSQRVHANKSENVKLEITEEKEDIYQIKTTLKMNAPEQLLWKIITEYEKTPEFVHSVKYSKVNQREKNRVFLEMRCEGGFILSIKVLLLLDMQENALQKKIDFVDRSDDKFYIFEGYWQVLTEGDKGLVQLHLKTKPKSTYWGLTRRIIEYSLTNLFVDIEKRAKALMEEEAKSRVSTFVPTSSTTTATETDTRTVTSTETKTESVQKSK